MKTKLIRFSILPALLFTGILLIFTGSMTGQTIFQVGPNNEF